MVGTHSLIFGAIFVQAVCGLPAVDKLGIIGGYNVTIQDEPFIVAIHEVSTTDADSVDQATCGGSIINDTFILTVASCFISTQWDSTRIQIRAASNYYNGGGAFLDVEKVICHEAFDEETKINDICLLKLTNPILFGWLASAALPEPDYKLKEGTQVNVTGWGIVQDSDFFNMKRSETLRQVGVTIASKDDCKSEGSVVKDTQICAGSKDHDICMGDSGNPLTYNGTLIGIVSYGPDFGQCGVKPSIYTRISSFVDWIRVTIEDNA